MFDIVGITVLVGLVVLFAWLVRRAWHAKSRILKWSGAVLSGLLTLVFASALAVALLGFARLNRTNDNPVSGISVDMTPETIAKGERFASFCAGCHAADESPPMEGNDFLGGEGEPPIGTVYAPNLTPTHLAAWTDGEIIRAIREGVHRNGRSLMIMPSRMFRNLSDDDVASIVAYLRSQPPVEPDTPPTRLNILGAIMVGLVPIVFENQPPVTEPVVAPPEGPTAEYGEYLASYACTLCHGDALGGSAEFETPGLVGVGLGWSDEQFISFFRTGLRTDNTPVSEEMPWEQLGEMFEDDELRAIFAYLGTLGP